MKIKLVFAILIATVIACGGGGNQPTATDAAKKDFKTYCVACHGPDGKMGLNGAKDFAESTMTLEERIEVITNGRNLMTPFKSLLKEDQIKELAEYTIVLGAAK